MNNTKTTKRALLSSVIAMFICVAMLIGTTFAWFTDSASTAVNKIQAGTLDIALEMKNADGSWVTAEGQTLEWKTADNRAQSEILWEPGCTYELPELRIVNNGDLALKYKMIVSGIEGDAQLLEAIEFTYGTGIDIAAEVSLQPNAATEGIIIKGHMKEEAGNEYQGLSIDGIGITVIATQLASEFDSYGNEYDANAVYPAAPAIVKAVASGKVTDATAPIVITDESSAIQATIPANTLSDNDNVVLTVERTAVTADSVTYDIDLKVNNATPTLVNAVSVDVNIGAGLKDVVATHNGNAMTKVDNAVNDQEYSYNGETGILTIVTKTFSPFNVRYKTDFAARIGNLGYATLDSAIVAAKAGDTVTLLKDVTYEYNPYYVLEVESNTVIDLNGKTITVPFMSAIFQGTNFTIKNGNFASDASYALWIGDEGTTDSVVIENVTVNGGINVYNADNVLLRNVTADATGHTYYAVWADENAHITVESGKYTGESGMAAILSCAEGEIAVKGGTFSTDPSEYVADGYGAVAKETYYEVVKGKETFDELSADLKLKNSMTVMGNDIVTPKTLYLMAGGNHTLLLNGKSLTSGYTAGANANKSAVIYLRGPIVPKATLTISGEGSVVGKDGNYAVGVERGTVNITGGTYEGCASAIYAISSGVVNISGGHFSVAHNPGDMEACKFTINKYDSSSSAKITVTGGTFVNFNPADNTADGAGTNYVAEGYTVVSQAQADGDIWYTVVPA